jgi:hypothetical protein
MLHNHSELACIYFHAWEVIGNEFFCTISEAIVDQLMLDGTIS